MQEYGHTTPKRLQACLYSSESKKYGSEAQAPLPPDATPKCKNCWEHLVLCTSSQRGGSYGPQYHHHRANKSNIMNIGKVHTIIGLPGGTREPKCPIPRIRHDNEYPF